MMYKLKNYPFSSVAVPNIVFRVSDNACIPFDPANTDFVEYQKWLDAGNTPLPADEVTQ